MKGTPCAAHLMFSDVDQELLLQKLLQNVFGSHIDQGLGRKNHKTLQHCSGTASV